MWVRLSVFYCHYIALCTDITTVQTKTNALFDGETDIVDGHKVAEFFNQVVYFNYSTHGSLKLNFYV